MKFFEEVEIGERQAIGAHTFTAAEIMRFGSAFDPQPFHTDEAAAEKSFYGGLIASGWHTLAVWMKLNVREMQRIDGELRASGRPVARMGPSPGFDTLKWLRPVYAGDTISFESEVTAKKASRSKPEWGLVTIKNIGHNQRGDEVVSFVGHVFIERADQGAPVE